MQLEASWAISGRCHAIKDLRKTAPIQFIGKAL